MSIPRIKEELLAFDRRAFRYSDGLSETFFLVQDETRFTEGGSEIVLTGRSVDEALNSVAQTEILLFTIDNRLFL